MGAIYFSSFGGKLFGPTLFEESNSLIIDSISLEVAGAGINEFGLGFLRWQNVYFQGILVFLEFYQLC